MIRLFLCCVLISRNWVSLCYCLSCGMCCNWLSISRVFPIVMYNWWDRHFFLSCTNIYVWSETFFRSMPSDLYHIWSVNTCCGKCCCNLKHWLVKLCFLRKCRHEETQFVFANTFFGLPRNIICTNIWFWPLGESITSGTQIWMMKLDILHHFQNATLFCICL